MSENSAVFPTKYPHMYRKPASGIAMPNSVNSKIILAAFLESSKDFEIQLILHIAMCNI
ncbi:hypothetical protein HMI54_000977 [Coelomomyces lativittatus]|nr:hypothetical protein HMI54_000977 [Coelomomyces lativittatus]